MNRPHTTPPVGTLLRDWRQRRRLSQLDLALDTDVSARHLSFIETGRSTPSRDMVIRLAERLDIPLRERNALLMAAGHAPVYAERALADPGMASAQRAVSLILIRETIRSDKISRFIPSCGILCPFGSLPAHGWLFDQPAHDACHQ